MSWRWWGFWRDSYKSTIPASPKPASCSIAPAITPGGVVSAGTVLTMSTGTWANASSFSYSWTENGVPAGSNSPTYFSSNSGAIIGGSVTANGKVKQAASNTVRISAVLQPLALSSAFLNENSAPGAIMGNVLNLTVGSTWIVLDSDGGRIARSGGAIAAGATNLDADADPTSRTFTIRETLGPLTNDTVIHYTVGNLNDTSPAPFSFSPVTGAALSTFVSAATPITISGLGPLDTASAVVSGDPSSRISKNGGAFVPGPVSVVNGNTLLPGNTSSASNSATTATTVSVGTTNATFTVQTLGAGGTADPTLTPPTMSLAVGPTTYPPQLNFDFTDANVQSGDTLAVRKSGAYPISGATVARILLTDTILSSQAFTFAANSDTPTFLSSITTPAKTYFNCFIERSTSHGPDSNTIEHGDATAATMVTSSPTTAAELQPTIANLVVSQPVTVDSITGPDGALVKVAETSPSTTLTIQPAAGGLSNYELKASLSYTLNVHTLGGVVSSLSMVSNLTDIDEVPNTTTFSPVSGATAGNHYQATYTITGIPAGVTIQLAISGTGASFKNTTAGGALGTAPITGVLNDVITVDVVADPGSGLSRSAILTGGDPSLTIGTFTVTTAGTTPGYDTTINTGSITYSNAGKTAHLNFAGNIRAFGAAGISSGKWYIEGLADVVGTNTGFGVAAANAPLTGWSGVLDAFLFVNGGMSGPGSPGGPYASYGAAAHVAVQIDLTVTPARMYVGLVNTGTGIVNWLNGNPVTPSGGLDISSFTLPIHACAFVTAPGDQWTLLASANQVGTPTAGYTRVG